ncbi:MAG: aminotransferase class V-fold PLP-dependent enzyme, partial [Oscillospiraceae bacterium]
VHIPAFMYGGGQEKAFRSGTESVPLICGFGAAVERYSSDISERFEKVKGLQKYLFESCGKCEGVHLISDEDCSPYVNSIAVEGLKSEVLLHFLEERGVYVSSGSACSKGKKSSVIKEFGVPEKYRDCVLRISFSSDSTCQEIDTLMEFVKIAQKTLCKIK